MRTLQKKDSREKNLHGTLLRKGISPRLEIILKDKIKDKLVQVKEEHNLISRFLILCRTRHNIDLPSYLGDYEFSVVPRSLFTPDGQL